MGAAKMPPQAHAYTQYAGWGGRMDSPARAARAAHAGLGAVIRPMPPDERGAGAVGGVVASGPSELPPFD